MLTRHDFNRQWSPVLTIFRIFGVTHFYSSTVRRTSCCSAVCFTLFRLYYLLLVLHLVFLGTLILVNILADSIGGLAGFIKRLIFVGELLVYLVTFIESSTTVHLQKDLLDQIFQLNCVLHQRMNVDFGMHKFCRKWKRILTVTSLTILMLIIGSAVVFGTEALDMVMVFIVPTMIAQVRVMQVAVFVDYLAEMLNKLKEIVQSEQTNKQGGIGLLGECMDLYSKLLKIAATISKTFGWSLVPIFALKICEWINTCYLSMLNTYVEKSIILHICRFN